MNNSPFFSILVPVYKVEDYIIECLMSLATQTFSDFEIVIVDDNSPDKSYELINELLAKNKQFSLKVVYHKNDVNKGLAEVRNISISLAKGKYICFVDGDDFVTPEFLDVFYKQIKETPVDVVYTSSIYIYKNEVSEVKKVTNFEGSLIKREAPDTYYTSLFPILPGYLVQCAFKRKLFTNVKFPSGCNFEDVLTIPLLMFNAESLFVFHTPTYYYRQQPNSITHKHSDKIIPLMKEINKLYPRWKELGVLKFYYLRYAKTARDTLYGTVNLAPKKEDSLHILRTWSKELKWRFIFDLIKYGAKNHLSVYLPLKLSPSFVYFMYKKLKSY